MSGITEYERYPVSAEEAERRLRELPGWRLEDGNRLVKTFEFKDFVQAVDFVNRITPVAEEIGHHPDLHVTWGKVTASLTTHVTDGLTEADFKLAAAIDRVGA